MSDSSDSSADDLESLDAFTCTTPRTKCCACQCSLYTKRRVKVGQLKRHVVTPSKRAEIFRYKRIVISPNQFICAPCKDANPSDLRFDPSQIQSINIVVPEFIKNAFDIQQEQDVRQQKEAERARNRQRRDPKKVPISLHNLSDEQIKYLCGVHIHQLKEIAQHVNDKRLIKDFKYEDLSVAFAIWKHNLSYRLAAILFGYASYSGICCVVDRVVHFLSKYWVGDCVGYGYWKDKRVRAHVPKFCQRLFAGKNVVGIADATYLYSQKSQHNYQYQKCTYSVYKARNLQKEHVVCTPDGKILFVDGPFFADGHNDDYLIWDWVLNNRHHDIHRIFPQQRYSGYRDRDGRVRKYGILADKGYGRSLDNDTFELHIPHGIEKESVPDSEGNKKKKPIRLTVEQRNASKFSTSSSF